MTVSSSPNVVLEAPPRSASALPMVSIGSQNVGPAGSATLELVQRRLRESSYYYLRTINCAFDEGVLTLRGRVPSYYLKQTVQALAEKVEGVQQVINLVDVMYPADACAV
jgi:osmotically-inducible protein OsmY